MSLILILTQWPQLCVLAMVGDVSVGVVVCKVDQHRDRSRGYIAMLAVDPAYRGQNIGIQYDIIINQISILWCVII